MSFETFISLITEKTPVRAGSVNSPLRQIDQNVRYLWDLIQAAGLGSTVYARQVTVEAAANVGMPVYFNETTQQFERGLATVDPNAAGVLMAADSAQVWGIVGAKFNATLADVLLFGLDTIDISQAVTGSVTPGVYYLSGTTPGILVRQKPPVSVAVLRYTPNGQVFVVPQFVDYLDRHVHYHFPLICLPAGDTTPPSPGNTHSITNSNSNLPGWLPADDPSFNGTAPDGAFFGYNLPEQPALNNAWPPLPTSQAYLEWNKGLDQDVGSTGVPTDINGLCILDRNGIWWMSNCYGDVPWPINLDTFTSSSSSSSISQECPRTLHMRLDLWFTKVDFATDTTVVRSLTSGDSRIKVYCSGSTTTATAGDLVLDLDLNIVVSTNQEGYLALKGFNPVTNTLTQGPVVEGVYATGTNVNIAGDIHEARVIDSVTYEVYQGLIGITVNPAQTMQLDVQLVRLDGCEEAFFQNMMYLAFRPGVQEDYRAKINIPDDLTLPSPMMSLRFRILGRSAGTLPQLVFSALILPRPVDGLVTPLLLPDVSDFAITCNTTGVLSENNQYIEAQSEPFSIAPGDVIFFTVQRLSTDGYIDEVGILSQVGIVTPG